MTPTDSTAAEIRAACAAAAAAAPTFAATSTAQRAALLRALANSMQAACETLVPLADRETHLGAGRLNGELDRTSFQLERFATLVEGGASRPVLDDAAVAGPPPAGHPRLTRVAVPLGPVAMFSASNFPFAFSVLGGDTASALAAGCPVVIKAHPGHPELSRAVFALAAACVAAAGLPVGVLQLVEGAGIDVGVGLVRDPAITSVAFTGSVRGGVALWREANARPRPIPFYGELGSINPLVALTAPDESQAAVLAGSITLGCGQFCTSPGVLIVRDDEASQTFVKQLADALSKTTPHAMLHPGIRAGFNAGVAKLHGRAGVKTLVAAPATGEGSGAPGAHLFAASAESFIKDEVLREEVFGPSCLVVTVKDAEEALQVLHAVEGTLTVTLWGADADTPENRRLVTAAQNIAGRVLFGSVPTGVAVTAGQQHGGPWPSSTQPFTTSVGDASIERFLRPVALQDAPAWLIESRGQA
jgi:NADP-dependent aldehyde dehydrogenase